MSAKKRGRQQPAGQPPTAGAVDLGALRIPPEKLEQAIAATLQQNAMVCACGERVRDEGVELVMLVVGAMRTQQGPQVGTGLASQTFHSGDCAALHERLAVEPKQGEPQPIAVRRVTPIYWLDEQSTPSGNEQAAASH